MSKMQTHHQDPQHQKPKLLDQVRAKIRLKHYSIRTEQFYVDWINHRKPQNPARAIERPLADRL